MNKRAALTAALLLFVVGLVGLVLVRGQRSVQATAAKAGDDTRADALVHESSLRKLVEVDDANYRRSYDTNLNVADPRRVLAQSAAGAELAAHYQTYFRYPHNSRPLNPDMFSLLDPLKIQTSPNPLFRAPPKTATQRPDYYAQFFAPRQSISGEEVFAATLKVEDANGVEVLPTITRAVVLSDVKTGRVELGNAQQFEARDAEHGLQGFAWKAPAATRLYWGELVLSVTLDIDGVALVQTLPFSSTPSVPARFTGTFREQLIDGSLVVKAELEASEAGSYVFESSLFHQQSGAPLGWSRNIVQVRPGKQEVDFLFFGRIFQDKQLAGTFALRHVRGYRQNRAYDPGAMLDRTLFLQTQHAQSREQQARAEEIADEPLHQFVAVWPTDYVTAPYQLADFSDREYEGADKARTLEAIAQNSQGASDAR